MREREKNWDNNIRDNIVITPITRFQMANIYRSNDDNFALGYIRQEYSSTLKYV